MKKIIAVVTILPKGHAVVSEEVVGDSYRQFIDGFCIIDEEVFEVAGDGPVVSYSALKSALNTLDDGRCPTVDSYMVGYLMKLRPAKVVTKLGNRYMLSAQKV